MDQSFHGHRHFSLFCSPTYDAWHTVGVTVNNCLINAGTKKINKDIKLQKKTGMILLKSLN